MSQTFGVHLKPKELNSNQRLSRREVLAASAIGAVLSACGSTNALATKAKLYHMGERVPAGQLIYVVLESEWLSALGSRVPKNKFLTLKVQVTNGGSSELAVPLLTLIDNKGQEVLESSEGEGLEEWLGVLRSLAATDTVQGKLLFDVPQDAYKLQVTDGGEPGSELTALIDIPLQIQERTRISAPGGENAVAPDPGATGN